METPTTALADRFVDANAEVQHLLLAATEAQLAHITPEEGWSILLLAHHLALAYLTHSTWVRQVAASEAVRTTGADLDAMNAQMVHDTPWLTRAVVLAELRANGAHTEALLRSLTPMQLATSAHFALTGGRAMTTEAVIRGILLGHFAAHVPHMRAVMKETSALR